MSKLHRPDARAWAKPLRSYRLRGRALSAAQYEALATMDRWGFPVVAAAAPIAAIATHDAVSETRDGWNTRAPVEVTDDGDGVVDLAELFGRDHPVVVEIGFGMADATIAMACAQPDLDLIAIDVHRPGHAALLQGIADHALTNIRAAHGDAVEILARQIAPGSLHEVRVFFPDPWPKTGHHRRRIVDAEFAALVANRLEVGGRLHLATDWEPYALAMREVIAGEPSLRNIAGDGLQGTSDGFVPRPEHRPITRFERAGIAKGHDVFDLIAERV